MSNIRMIALDEPSQTVEYSYEALYKEYHPQLVSSFHRVLGSRGILLDLSNGKRSTNMLSEEMAQEVMLKVFENWNAIQWSTIRTYISIVAWHLFVDYTRTSDCSIDSRKTDDDPLIYLDVFGSPELQGLVDPLLLLQNERMINKVSEAMKEMKPADKELFTQIYLKGESPKEIAEELGVSYPTLRKRVSRARNILGKREDYDK